VADDALVVVAAEVAEGVIAAIGDEDDDDGDDGDGCEDGGEAGDQVGLRSIWRWLRGSS
jgi:hypothetical protein